MLTTIIIPTDLISIIRILLIIIFIAYLAFLLLRIRDQRKHREGLILGQSLYDGKPITLDKTWVGSTFWIHRVFKQFGNTHSKSNHVHLLEASNHLESASRLFIISEAEYEQLLLDDKNTLGKEYRYISTPIRPGVDTYCFKRQ
jgi:hypothetical protein